jgi:hypothetical protein
MRRRVGDAAGRDVSQEPVFQAITDKWSTRQRSLDYFTHPKSRAPSQACGYPETSHVTHPPIRASNLPTQDIPHPNCVAICWPVVVKIIEEGVPVAL